MKKETEKEKKKKYNLLYINKEHNFIKASLRIIFKPSRCNPKQFRNHQRKSWAPELTLQELYGELLLHIQLMKYKFPESNGRLCRYCDRPWTTERSGENKIRISSNFSIDRFNTNETYKKNNIVFCCGRCNSLKNGSTKEMWTRLLEIDKEMKEDYEIY
tara:strand:- start:32 stop:508 length:477 start_codon:yes stop_codon:yes gene_type:complete